MNVHIYWISIPHTFLALFWNCRFRWGDWEEEEEEEEEVTARCRSERNLKHISWTHYGFANKFFCLLFSLIPVR